MYKILKRFRRNEETHAKVSVDRSMVERVQLVVGAKDFKENNVTIGTECNDNNLTKSLIFIAAFYLGALVLLCGLLVTTGITLAPMVVVIVTTVGFIFYILHRKEFNNFCHRYPATPILFIILILFQMPLWEILANLITLLVTIFELCFIGFWGFAVTSTIIDIYTDRRNLSDIFANLVLHAILSHMFVVAVNDIVDKTNVFIGVYLVSLSILTAFIVQYVCNKIKS